METLSPPKPWSQPVFWVQARKTEDLAAQAISTQQRAGQLGKVVVGMVIALDPSTSPAGFGRPQTGQFGN